MARKERLPSVRTLQQLIGNGARDGVTARTLRAELERDAPASERLRNVDTMIGYHGVEFLRTRKGSYEYCNSGDSYGVTLIRDRTRGRFFVCDWGTLVEREDRVSQRDTGES